MPVEHSVRKQRASATSATCWQQRLPELSDGVVSLRELRRQDAASLLRHVNDRHVPQFVSQSQSSIEGFERFVRWTHLERGRGRHACYGIVAGPGQPAVGVIQIWSVEHEFSTAEWGFALGAQFWGSGIFTRSAHLFLDAIFIDRIVGGEGVYRLEARTAVGNRRGSRAFRKLGATREGILRGACRTGDQVTDHVMWSMLAPEWIDRRATDAASAQGSRRYGRRSMRAEHSPERSPRPSRR
jgi:RimJ/RimL family protein N-acetyltransferase